ncbi:hypothetical protein, partial [Staphylococcus haemolyticus]
MAIIISLFVKSISPITSNKLVWQALALLATSFTYVHSVLQTRLLGVNPQSPLFANAKKLAIWLA